MLVSIHNCSAAFINLGQAANYAVFGPKLVATRGYFEDRALESRCLTEEMGQTRLREDVPINLPSFHKDEALRLRNKLLLFRFRNFRRRQASEDLVDRSIEPRLNQIFVPLLSIIDRPSLPLRPTSPKPVVNAILLALFMPVVWLAVLLLRPTTVAGRRDE